MTYRKPRIATLESFIIDTFTTVRAGKEVAVDKPDQIGGAGTYAIIGARIFLPPSRLGMIVDYTPVTLPEDMRLTLEAYGADMWELRERTDGHGTIRAVNRYSGQVRGFEYLTQPLAIGPRDIVDSRLGSPLPTWLHLVSYPARADAAIAAIAAINKQVEGGWAPGFLWEPEPPACVPENLDVLIKISRNVDVLSPNHTEAMALFGISEPSDDTLVATLEWVTQRLTALRPRIAVILRAGPLGCCYALTSDLPPGTYDAHSKKPPPVAVHWAPPYWEPGMDGYETAVVDPTGAGNAFMGGLMAALDEGKDMHEAVIWANVAASLVIEQDGLPKLTSVLGREVWNGDYPWERVEALKRRMA